MRCDSPLRINNKYTGQRMLVGCRKCDSCLIASANAKTLLLMNELKKDFFALYITLTYDNNHLPVVFYGDDRILRIKDDGFEELEKLDEKVSLCPCEPVNYPYIDCTGVIYYKDFQNFMKRLRINLKRDYNYVESIRYFVCCEYGSTHRRPHFHAILFCQRRTDLNRIADVTVKSWRMCDETVTRNGFKIANAAISSYLAAYVNCNSNSYSFAKHRFFRQKAYRSACLDYGTTAQDKEEIKRVIESQVYTYSDGDDRRPFEYFDYSRKDWFSTCFVSQRVFYTYFRKPYGYANFSPFAFRIRARIIYYYYTKDWRYFPHFCRELKQADKNFYRGYLCYLDLMGYVNNEYVFEFYIDVFLRMMSLYNAMVLRNYMMSFEEPLVTSVTYLMDAYNTESKQIGSSGFWHDIFEKFGTPENDYYSYLTRQQLKKYHFDYGKRLIPKHRSSMYNVLF